MTNRNKQKQASSRRTPTVDVPSDAIAILQILPDDERRVMSLRWGIESGRPLHQTEVAKIVGVNHSTVSRMEKAVRERIAELTPSQLNTLVEAHEAQKHVEVIDGFVEKIEELIAEVHAIETRLMKEITRVEAKIVPSDPPAAPKRVGLFRRSR